MSRAFYVGLAVWSAAMMLWDCFPPVLPLGIAMNAAVGAWAVVKAIEWRPE